MLKKERQLFILHQVTLHNRVQSANLCRQIRVSEDTIRRDLQELADAGKIVKVHGGALSLSFAKVNFAPSQVYSQDLKKTIGQKAAELIGESQQVLTTGGSTIIEFARALPRNIRATFITGSFQAVGEYMKHPNLEVIMVGDKVSKHSKITVGPLAIEQIKRFQPDICFLGVNALDIKHGVTDEDWDVVMVKRAMIEVSKKVVCLTISEKVGKVRPLQICSMSDIDMIITEMDPNTALFDPYRKAGIEVL